MTRGLLPVALGDAWAALAAEAGADPRVAAADGERLAARYREPHRAYHTLDHVADVLDGVDWLGAAEGLADLWPVHAAAWFHDAVYEPAADDNEEASARLAGEVIGGWGVRAATAERVAALVLATATHRADDPEAAVLVDADLAVLAAPAPRYEAYARAIRTEYAHIDEAAFRAGRRAFVEHMLARERIFATATMARSAEAAARRNLAAEHARLAPA